MVVLEKITAPASRKRAAGGASAAAGTSLVVAAPSGTGTPLVAMFSLMVTGTPSSGPAGSPFCQRAVEPFAVARAPSGSNAYRAFMCGSHTAICASTSSSTSVGENCLARKPAIRSTALRSCSGVTVSLRAALCMGAHRKPRFDDAREHAGADRQNLVVEDVAWIVQRHRAFLAEPEIGAGHGVQHVGKILAAHLRRRPGDDFAGIDDGTRDLGNDLRMLLAVGQDAEDTADIHRYLDLEGACDARTDRAHALADLRAHAIVERAHRAAELCLAGNHVVSGAGMDLRDRQHRRLQRIDVAADDALQGLPHCHRDD